MPVILAIPSDPADQVLQGEQLRSAALRRPVAAPIAPLVAGDQDLYPMMVDGILPADSQMPCQAYSAQIRANALIATPCGELIAVDLGRNLLNDFIGATDRWLFSGTTRNSSLAALPGCRVIVFDPGQLAVGGNPVVGETISDGAGAYSIEVPGNRAYQATAYLVGSPDVAGITVNTATPVQSG